VPRALVHVHIPRAGAKGDTRGRVYVLEERADSKGGGRENGKTHLPVFSGDVIYHKRE